MVEENALRTIAMALPGVEERPHSGRQAFRARKIFATLGGGTVNLLLVPEQAAMLIEAEPDLFLRLGGWTKHGWTGVRLELIDRDRLEMLLRDAWRQAAPKGTTID
jgi:hypothetical protein